MADLSIKDTDDDEKRAIEQLNRKKLQAQSKAEPSPLQEFLSAVKDRPIASQVVPPEVAHLHPASGARDSADTRLSSGTGSLDKFGVSAPSTSAFREGVPQSEAGVSQEKVSKSSSSQREKGISKVTMPSSLPPEAPRRLHFQSDPVDIRHSVRGNELEKETTYSHQSREALMLKLAREARQNDTPEDRNFRIDSRARSRGFDSMSQIERDTVEKAGDSSASVSSESDHSGELSSAAAGGRGGDGHRKGGRRKRVRKRIEIRKRFVKQLLIRGENVVLVNAVDG